MSYSRLEKFIYAICSMDVTDLPVPLSRIEKLWNCLITGETPDFEPLSRNEKYLMAMLDRYDISNLPAPMSRGEKLLYKIAVGETDLSDVPGYLSRYEELLKYLIENGGISGGDFEYVLYTFNQSLYTLYTTAEKPVKSAILKGQTLVNLVPKQIIDYTATSDWDGFKALGQNSATQELWRVLQDLKPNTKYFISCYVETFNVGENQGYLLNNSAYSTVFAESLEVKATGLHKWVLTSKSEFTEQVSIALRCQNKNARGVIKIRDIMIVEYQQGMENWDIPYFEGMQSVKMPVLTTTNCLNLFTKDNTVDDGGKDVFGDFVEAKKNDKFSFNDKYGNGSWTSLVIYNVNKERIYYKYGDSSSIPKTIVLPDDDRIAYVRPRVANIQMDTIMFNRGEVIPYEEYKANKTNILSTPSDLELRGIDDVQDTLDLLTGEVIERISEVVLDGSENWVKPSNQPTNTVRFLLPDFPNNRNTKIKSNFKVKKNAMNDEIGIWCDVNTVLNLDTSVDTVDSLKVFLSKNPIKLQYSLATESIKTVDLTTVDQDNQPTQLGTFENITHVSLESAGLIPEVEMEVATNLLEDTVFTLTNAFNTLYPTAAKPVVDGTLYGQTKYRDISTNKIYDSYSDAKNIWSTNNYKLWCDKDAETTNQLNGTIDNGTDIVTLDFLTVNHSAYKLIGNCTYKKIVLYNSNKQYISGQRTTTSTEDLIYSVPSNARYVRFSFFSGNDNKGSCSIVDENDNPIDFREELELVSCQAPGITITNEDGTKSTTLSTPSDLELRKVGKVRDELNVMTGEVVEHVDEIILNGNEYWDTVNNTFRTSIIRDKVIKLETQADRDKIVISCDRYPSRTYNDPWLNNSGNSISLTIDGIIVIKDANFTTVEEWKQYLSQNTLTIKFVLATPTTKTVDLSVVNQDGNEAKLRTFDDTTHVLLNSEGVPMSKASLTVRTKIPSASSTSLLMDDISNEQQQLNTTVNEQSNNVDATMIATTEIYEETL